MELEKKPSLEKKLQCKILVLGSANAGKSTLVRNIRMIHGGTFSDEEIYMTIEQIRAMTMEALVDLIKDANVADKASKELRHLMYAFMSRVDEWRMGSNDDSFSIDPKLITQALKISRDPLVQECLSSESCKKLLNENCSLIANLEINLSKDYYPSNDDILTVRKPTKVK